jgi:hypothetical protein
MRQPQFCAQACSFSADSLSSECRVFDIRDGAAIERHNLRLLLTDHLHLA